MTLVFVHGRAQEEYEEDVLRGKWRSSLEKGLRNAGRGTDLPEIRFPYYARTLVPLAEDAHRGGGGVEQFAREFRIEAVAERAPGPSTAGLPSATPPDAAPGYVVEDDDRPRDGTGKTATDGLTAADDETRGALNWPITLGFARFLDARWASFASATVDRILEDVGTYLSERDVQAKVDAIVREQIEAAEEPRVIVAHSLGSVVTFRVLHSLGGKIPVVHLVTIGSPLGARAVSSRVGVPLLWPPGIQRWSNGSDRRDIVALQPALDRDSLFAGADGRGRLDVENFVDIRNFTANHHSIEGYLEDPIIATRIVEGLSA